MLAGGVAVVGFGLGRDIKTTGHVESRTRPIGT